MVEVEPGLEILPPETFEPEDADQGLPRSRQSTDSKPSKSPSPKSTSKDVVIYDPLSAYLREMGRFKPLSREEEHVVALQYYRNKDVDAAYKLITSNLWLVVKIARDYERAARNLLDLVQEGNIGLMEAVKNFDPFRGVRFPSYAVWWIRAYMVRYLIANWRLVKIGTTQAQRKLFFNLKKERDKLERQGIYPTPTLLAEKLAVRESDVVEMEQRLSSSDISVDSPINEDQDTPILALLSHHDATAEELLAKKEMRRLIAVGLSEFTSTLKPKEVVIFNQRILPEEKATLQDIAEKLLISRERVRQIENRIREKLKEFFLKRLPSEELEG